MSGTPGEGAHLLRSFIYRIEALEEEKRGCTRVQDRAERRKLRCEIEELYGEAETRGFDSAAMRQVIADRALPKMQQHLRLVALYHRAMGEDA